MQAIERKLKVEYRKTRDGEIDSRVKTRARYSENRFFSNGRGGRCDGICFFNP